MVKDLAGFKERNKAVGLSRVNLASELALKTGDSKLHSRVVVDALMEVIQEALEAGKLVELRGFGSFWPKRKRERRSYVPTKGRVVKVDARWTVLFKTSKELKKSLMANLED